MRALILGYEQYTDFWFVLGTPRRKVKKITKSAGTDDRKLQATLQKLSVQPIAGIEEVNMFKEDGNVIHFANPKGKCCQTFYTTLYDIGC
jgi:hypothetical protein